MSKKGIIILTIIAVIIIAVVAVVGIVIFKLYKEKDPLSTKNFISKMIDKGYTVIDAKDQFIEEDSIKTATIAMSKNSKYQIEFYELESVSVATKFFGINKTLFESEKGNTSTERSLNGKNYSKYELSSNGRYMVISRIDATVIYADVDSEYKSDVKDLLKELGY